MADEQNTSGVQELIDKLSQEGVAEGEQQAATIINEARQKAEDIVDAARRQAAETVRKGHEEAEQFQKAGEEALRLASRDAVRDFGAKVHDGLRNRLQELVQHQLKEPDLIKRMILEITRTATEDLENEPVELLIPRDIVTEQESRRRIEASEHDVLTEFVEGLIGEDLREGSKYEIQSQNGIIIRVVNDNVEIDLTDESIAGLIARHLLPRFRAIMRKA